MANSAVVTPITANTLGIASKRIDTFDINTHRTVKYIIQIQETSNNYFHSTEILLIHDGTTPYLTEYATIFSSSSLGTITANTAAGNVNILLAPTYANNNIRISRDTLAI